jgi:hypothetical protein
MSCRHFEAVIWDMDGVLEEAGRLGDCRSGANASRGAAGEGC